MHRTIWCWRERNGIRCWTWGWSVAVLEVGTGNEKPRKIWLDCFHFCTSLSIFFVFTQDHFSSRLLKPKISSIFLKYLKHRHSFRCKAWVMGQCRLGCHVSMGTIFWTTFTELWNRTMAKWLGVEARKDWRKKQGWEEKRRSWRYERKRRIRIGDIE